MRPIVKAASARGNRLHTHEDITKMENLINVMLFGAFAIPQFWAPFCDLVGIPQHASLTREVIDGTGERPDYIIYGVGPIPGCFEIELGKPNAQLTRYRKTYDPVICIVGRKGDVHGWKSLEEIAVRAKSIALDICETNHQGAEWLRLLAKTIKDALDGFTDRPSIKPIPAHLLELGWFSEAIKPLAPLMDAGYIVNKTWSDLSLSLRLQGVPCMGRKSLALLTRRSGGKFLVPVPAEMRRVIGETLADVTVAWTDLIRKTKPEWSGDKDPHTDRNHRTPIDEVRLEQHAEHFAAVFNLLAKRLLPAAAR